MRKYLLLQVAIGDYRQAFIDELRSRYRESLTIAAGDCYFSASVITRIAGEKIEPIKNIFLLGRRVCVQIPSAVTLLQIWSADVVIAEGNPRVLSTWAILLLRRCLRRKTVLWMHAWPRAGRGSPTDHVRGVMRRLAHGLILYTETQRRELSKIMPRKPIWVAPNALYKVGQIPLVGESGLMDSLLYVGRLVPEKKPELILKALVKIKERGGDMQVNIVGDGPMLAKLQVMVSECGLSNTVHFHGHVSCPRRLFEFYDRATATISPGYVGLAITQSLFFGVPMIVANGEPHSPEIEAAIEGFNAVFFEADSVDSLAHAMLLVHAERRAWRAKAPKIKDDVESRYSVGGMVDGVSKALEAEL